MYIGIFEELIAKRQTIFIEFKECFNKLHKEKLVVAHKGRESRFCINSSTIWMSLVSNFISQIDHYFIKSFKMANIFVNNLFGEGIWFFTHEGIQCFLIIHDDFPCGTNACKYIRQILHPTVEILILKLKLLIFSAIGLQSNVHLCILFDEQIELKLLIFHVEYLYQSSYWEREVNQKW